MVPCQFPSYRLTDRLSLSAILLCVQVQYEQVPKFTASFQQDILENTTLLSQTIPYFLLTWAEECK